MGPQQNSNPLSLLSRLKLPLHSASSEGLFYTDDKELKEWISHLPLANPKRSVEELLDTLSESNRHNIPSTIRLNIVESLRLPIHSTRHSLEKDSQLSRKIDAELANAYKIVVIDSLLNEPKRKKSLLSTAIHRGIRHLSDLVIASTISYETGPTNSWQEIHSLYSLACDLGMENQQIEDSFNKPISDNSIQSQYIQIILYTLASPFYLRQQDCQLMQGRLAEWSNFIDLKQIESKNKPTDVFVVRLASDEPPIHIKLQTKRLSRRCRLLDTQRLITYLETLQTSEESTGNPIISPQTNQTDYLPLPLLNHLIKSWDSKFQRRRKRTTLALQLQLAIGFQSILTLLKKLIQQPAPSKKHGSTDEQEHLLWFQGQTGSSDNHSEPLSTDEQPPHADPSQTVVSQTIVEKSAPWTKVEDDQAVQTYTCKTINESQSGFCIRWQGLDDSKIEIGELVGIQSAIDDNKFAVCIVRWVKQDTEARMHIGMEILSPNVMTMDIYDRNGHHQNCILLPEMEDKRRSSIITPPLTCQAGNILLMNEGKEGHKIKLSQLAGASASYERYFFHDYVEEEQEEELPATDESDIEAEDGGLTLQALK